MFTLLLATLGFVCAAEAVWYDPLHSKPATDADVQVILKKNITNWCLVDIQTCDPNAPRTFDGSCNNLEFPSRGAPLTPYRRLLPPNYSKDFANRKSESGEPLKAPRALRCDLLPTGRVPDTKLTTLTMSYMLAQTADITSVQDTINFLRWNQHCCLPEGKTDPECIPLEVSPSDPVHRFSNVRCMNLTKPISFQNRGCPYADQSAPPDRINAATQYYDLSFMYGNNDKVVKDKVRTFNKGLLKIEKIEGKDFPPSIKNPKDNFCIQNVLPRETYCHDTPEQTTIIGTSLILFWFWRFHNHIATALAEVNPCWDDEKLFQTARDLTMSCYTHILYYEVLPAILGHDNLLKDGVIVKGGFREIYDKNILPQMALETPFAMRTMHGSQNGDTNMYDANGTFTKKEEIVALTLRPGFMVIDNNMEAITQGCFRQPTANFDYVVDPIIADKLAGPQQLATDVFSNDLAKNRAFGFQPYVEYIKLFSGATINSFDDLKDLISPENLETLKSQYAHVRDIDLIAGMWMEKHKHGARTGPTFYSFMKDHFIHIVKTDRHWYERKNRPHAFTAERLQEIKKITMSRVLCNVGDKVTRIQPNAFHLPGPGNEIVDCGKIPHLNLRPWTDNSCEKILKAGQ